MLIVLGGFLGSGRQILARKLAAHMKFHFYDLNEKKEHLHFFDKKNNFRERILSPRTDALRTKVFQDALTDFPHLIKMYPDMVMEDSMHRRAPRDLFLKEAQKFFDEVVFIWIESPDETVLPRLEWMKRKQVIHDVPLAVLRREHAMKEFESFISLPLVFFYKNIDAQTIERLEAFIRHCLKRNLSVK